MKRIIFILCLLPLFAHADIYQWTKKDGTIVFTDTPHKGAQTVDLPPVQTYSSKKPQTTVTSTAATTTINQPQNTYTSLDIVVPEDDATLRDNNGNMSVAIAYQPGLRSGDKIALFLDGRQVQTISRGNSFSLSNVDRGTHKLQIKITSSKGDVLMTSGTTTFHMHQAFVKNGKTRS